MFDLSGKTALVTGASGGIGGAIVTALHKQGANIALSGTRNEVINEMASSMGDNVSAFAIDLSDKDAGSELIERVNNEMGEVDILVNNAGVTRDNLILRLKSEDLNFVLNVNLVAAFELSRACIRGMMKQRWGRIINITSVVGVTGNAGQTNYAASKAGIIGMSKSLAQEVASRGITVNCIAPGFIETAMTAKLSDQNSDKLRERIPVGRMGSVDDVASAVVYLASKQASYITGHTLHVNGGLAML